jgi:murein DD-endopeptidase MepM/ murein hydrolase activator NlpD
MWVEFDRSEIIPNKLVHCVETSGGAEEGAAITTDQTQLRVLGPPLEGADWLASDGPSNDENNHHRRGVFVLNGSALDDRRFAIDWKQVKNGATYSGDARDVQSYYSYGKPVLAVADARVVAARDGLPDNIPGHGAAFHPAVPITLDTIAGNTITLDLGSGQFAYYMHLQPGSLRVHAGDRVRRGQPIARVGATGDAREPHLHYEVTNSPELALGEGVPYLIDRYWTKTANGATELHTRELPLDHEVADFIQAGGK